MKNLLLAFTYLWVMGCHGGRGVDFSSSKKSEEDGDGASAPGLSGKQKPPQVDITRYPEDHILGERTQIGFEIIPGDNPISTMNCFLDHKEVDCKRGISELLFEGLQEGKHFFRVEVKDTAELGDSKEASWMIYTKTTDDYQKRQLQIQVESHDNKADILFVIDNSESMNEEQQGIAGRITNLFSKISELDWRLGIITTDPYEFDPKTNGYNPLADGALLRFPNGSYQLDAGLGITEANNLFSRTIYRPERGNGHERGIYNTYRAIERAVNPTNDVNRRLHDFFRPGASLSVILISDEDETLLDGVKNPLPNQVKSDGANLIRLIKSQWEEKVFQFNSVIVQPHDKNNCSDKNTKIGHAYFELSRLTGGVVEDICARGYGGALDKIGTGVVNLEKSYLLDCEPMDINGDGQVEINIIGSNGQPLSGYQLDGRVIQFDQLLKTGDYEINYFCPMQDGANILAID